MIREISKTGAFRWLFAVSLVTSLLGATSCNFERATSTTGINSLLLQAPGPTDKPPTDLIINSFVTNTLGVSPGGSAQLSWSITNASAVSIDNGIGNVSPRGTVSVTPNSTTTYTLSATGTQNGAAVTLTQSVSIVVLESNLPAASIAFLTNPENGGAGSPLPPFSLGALDQNGAATGFPSGTACSLSVSSNSSGGLIGGTYQDVAASGAQVVFNQVSFQLAGTYSLIATCTGIAQPTLASPSFTVSGNSVQSIGITYTNIPTYGWMNSGQTLVFVLGLNDPYGNPIANGTVTASLPSGSQGTLSGATTVPISGGVATFGIAINTTISQEFVLTFTSGSAALPVTVPISVPTGLVVPSIPAVTTVNGLYTDGTSLYIATDQGIAKSSDGGNTFAITVPASTVGASIGVRVFGGVYYSLSSAGAPYYETLLTIVNGTTVLKPSFYCDGTGPNNVYDITVSGGTILVGTQCGLYSSTDGGNTFTQMTLPTGVNGGISELAVTSTGTIYAAVYYDGVIVSTDGGQTFSAIAGFTGKNVNNMWLVNDVLYVENVLSDANGDYEGSVLSRTADGGKTVTTPLTTAQGLSIVNMAIVNGEVYAVNYNQGQPPLWGSTDGGNTFASLPAKGGNYVFDGMSMIGFNGAIYASYPTRGTYTSLLCRSTDKGQTFQCSL